MAESKDLAPNSADHFRRADDFKTVFARVTGARNPDRFAAEFKSRDLVLFQFGHAMDDRSAARCAGKTIINELRHLRLLHGDSARLIGTILQLDVSEFA